MFQNLYWLFWYKLQFIHSVTYLIQKCPITNLSSPLETQIRLPSIRIFFNMFTSMLRIMNLPSYSFCWHPKIIITELAQIPDVLINFALTQISVHDFIFSCRSEFNTLFQNNNTFYIKIGIMRAKRQKTVRIMIILSNWKWSNGELHGFLCS